MMLQRGERPHQAVHFLTEAARLFGQDVTYDDRMAYRLFIMPPLRVDEVTYAVRCSLERAYSIPLGVKSFLNCVRGIGITRRQATRPVAATHQVKTSPHRAFFLQLSCPGKILTGRSPFRYVEDGSRYTEDSCDVTVSAARIPRPEAGTRRCCPSSARSPRRGRPC